MSNMTEEEHRQFLLLYESLSKEEQESLWPKPQWYNFSSRVIVDGDKITYRTLGDEVEGRPGFTIVMKKAKE